MTTQTIAIKYKNPPREGKKMGNVKTAGGDVYWFYREMSERLTEGHTIQAIVDHQTWGEGSNAKQVQVIKSIADGGAPAQPPLHAAGHNSNGYASGTTLKDETIFVTGIVGRAMGSGKFGVTDIRALTLAAREAYQEVYGDPSP